MHNATTREYTFFYLKANDIINTINKKKKKRENETNCKINLLA